MTVQNTIVQFQSLKDSLRSFTMTILTDSYFTASEQKELKESITSLHRQLDKTLYRVEPAGLLADTLVDELGWSLGASQRVADTILEMRKLEGYTENLRSNLVVASILRDWIARVTWSSSRSELKRIIPTMERLNELSVLMENYEKRLDPLTVPEQNVADYFENEATFNQIVESMPSSSRDLMPSLRFVRTRDGSYPNSEVDEKSDVDFDVAVFAAFIEARQSD